MHISNQKKIELGWKALHMTPGEPDRSHQKEACFCEPETGNIPCVYCTLYDALKVADTLLDENVQLRGDCSRMLKEVTLYYWRK